MSFQVVIITGAASGIGAATAIAFAKLHAGICIADINAKDLRKTTEECQKLSKNKVLEVVADMRKDEDRDNIIQSAMAEFGKIDVLVNCAGIYKITKIQDADIIENFDKMFAINLRSVVAVTKKALPALIESKGCVINISSVCSSLISDISTVYCMTKAGITIFTKCIALELARLGVRVNCIAPGPVKTNIYINAGVNEDENDELWNSFKESVPMKKMVKAEEIADLAVYLASDKAASITGAEFVVDAGMLLGASQVPTSKFDK